jgi:hypothetical protein
VETWHDSKDKGGGGGGGGSSGGSNDNDTVLTYIISAVKAMLILCIYIPYWNL